MDAMGMVLLAAIFLSIGMLFFICIESSRRQQAEEALRQALQLIGDCPCPKPRSQKPPRRGLEGLLRLGRHPQS